MENNKSKKPPLDYKEYFNPKNPKENRKWIRLIFIKIVIRWCFYGLGAVGLIILLDIFHFEKGIAQHSSVVIITAVLSSTLTTALGAIIGSSID